MNDASPSATSTSNPPISHDEIARRAQELWESYGRPSGRDEEIWLEAERELNARHTAVAEPVPAPMESPAVRSLDPAPAAPPRPGRGSATARMPGGRSRGKG